MNDFITLNNWKSVVGIPFPIHGITDKTKTETAKRSAKFRGSVRLATGRYLSDKEYDEYAERVRNTPLP